MGKPRRREHPEHVWPTCARTEFAHSPFLAHQQVTVQASAWKIRCREGKQCGQGQATDEHHARGQRGARQGPEFAAGSEGA